MSASEGLCYYVMQGSIGDLAVSYLLRGCADAVGRTSGRQLKVEVVEVLLFGEDRLRDKFGIGNFFRLRIASAFSGL